MQTIKKLLPGTAVCLAIAIPSWLLGKAVPVIGGPVFSILIDTEPKLRQPRDRGLPRRGFFAARASAMSA